MGYGNDAATVPIPVEVKNGGTGATNPADALTNLGIGGYYHGEVVATELVTGADKELGYTLLHEPGGGGDLFLNGKRVESGVGKAYQRTGVDLKKFTWQPASGTGSGDAPDLATSDRLVFSYGTNTLALGTASAAAIADFAPIGATRIAATTTKTNDTAYTSATYDEILELDTTFTSRAGDHCCVLSIVYIQTVAQSTQRFAYRVDGGSWVQCGAVTAASGFAKSVSMRFPLTLTAASHQIEVAVKTSGGTTNIQGASEVPSMLTIEGP